MKRESKRTGVFTRRALLVAGAQVGALGYLGVKLYQAQVLDGARYATLAASNRISARLIAPRRAGACSTASARWWPATGSTGGRC